MYMTQVDRDRFWKFVGHWTINDCIPWIGTRNRAGYGNFHLNGQTRGAHRVSYVIAKGPIPDGLVIDHRCYNTWCVNFEHLEAVTPAVNSQRRRPPVKRAVRRIIPWSTVVHDHAFDPWWFAYDGKFLRVRLAGESAWMEEVPVPEQLSDEELSSLAHGWVSARCST